MKTTVLMKYVKLGWRMRGEANETKSNQIDRIVIRLVR